jgi:ABC-type glycerol-3-phosphate transport system substrate-binding protein
MKRKTAGRLAILVALALLALCSAQAKVKAAVAGRTLKVKLNYTGAGTVDKNHKIHALLFDCNL